MIFVYKQADKVIVLDESILRRSPAGIPGTSDPDLVFYLGTAVLDVPGGVFSESLHFLFWMKHCVKTT